MKPGVLGTSSASFPLHAMAECVGSRHGLQRLKSVLTLRFRAILSITDIIMSGSDIEIGSHSDDDGTTAIRKRIKDFTSNPTHGTLKLTPLQFTRCSTSVCNSTGVRVKDQKNKAYFRCLVGDCYLKNTFISLTKSSTAKATAHLKDVHGITSSKTQSHNANVASLKKQLQNCGIMTKDPKRWFKVRYTTVLYLRTTPF